MEYSPSLLHSVSNEAACRLGLEYLKACSLTFMVIDADCSLRLFMGFGYFLMVWWPDSKDESWEYENKVEDMSPFMI